MKIADSKIDFSSKHTLLEKHTHHESLRVWGQQGEQEENPVDRPVMSPTEQVSAPAGIDAVQLSPQALMARRPARAEVQPVADDQLPVTDLNLQILRKLIERITGKVIDVGIPRQTVNSGQEPPSPAQSGAPEPPAVQGFGMEYNYYESHYESESTSFEAAGIIRTEDGMEIDFSAQLNMSREFMTEKRITIQVGEPLKDPLVINFNGAAAELTEREFIFDIDADGEDEQISFVAPGSGFLAYDRDGNGSIDDGSELFGPVSGNGFNDLAAFDGDNNNWIDENDDIFEHLRIWTKDADGKDHLFALGEKGVGAIYVNHIETPFLIKNNDNELLGKVRSSGVVANEDGSVGIIQQIDLAV